MFTKLFQVAGRFCVNTNQKMWQYVICPMRNGCVIAFHSARQLGAKITTMTLRTVTRIVVISLALIGVLKLIPPLSTRGSEQLPMLQAVEREAQDSQPVAERGVIVFIHGLGGDLQETWQASKDTPTFMKLMAEDLDLSRYDIYTRSVTAC